MGDVIERLAIPAHVPADRVLDFDIYMDPGMARDPHARVAEMRARSPNLSWTPRNGGHWLIFGRDELQQALSGDPAFSSRRLGTDPSSEGQRLIPLSLDPPEHTPWRHLLLKYFGPKEIRAMEPFVRQWAERLISALAGKTSCEFIHEVGEPMPVSVFMEMMGFPLERFDEFRALAAGALKPDPDPSVRPMFTVKIFAVLREIIGQRRAAPRDDLISRLLAERYEGRPLSAEEIDSICFLLFLAGLDTVTNAMGYGMRHLATHPEEQAALRADRSLIPAAVERLLRLYTFINTVRVATRDVELGGVTIKEGDALQCVLWSAGADAAADDRAARHMAFGSGPHLCLGIHLARLELRVMYETWFARMGAFSLVPGDEAVMHGGVVMSIERLPLTLSPR